MRTLYAILLACVLGAALPAKAQYIDDNPRLLDSLLSAHRDKNFYRSHTLGNADSVWLESEQSYLPFDTTDEGKAYNLNRKRELLKQAERNNDTLLIIRIKAQ